MRIKSFIPIKIDIGEEEKLALGVKRLTFAEATELRAKWKEAENAPEEKKTELWAPLLLDSFRRYLRLECEVIVECADGEVKLRKAEELLEFFGGATGILNRIFFSIMLENSLTPEKKRLLQWDSVTKPSSPELEKEAPGPKPETTATSAGNGASAEPEVATPPETAPSGSTDPATETPDDPSSSSTNVRSLH